MENTLHKTWSHALRYVRVMAFIAAVLFLVLGASGAYAQSADPEQSGSVGLNGQISAPPPTQGATINAPNSGSLYTDQATTITVSGTCPDGLLVKMFKNNVFAGSAQCVQGAYSIQIDLFAGQNELIARVFDDLDQPGPESNVVEVEYNPGELAAPELVTLTSNFAKRGSFPGENLSWPISLSGGTGPYAISIDWGDGSELELFTETFPGNIDLNHVYVEPGVYSVIIKAVDANGAAAFLQLVGVANGPLSQDVPEELTETASVTPLGASGVRIVWWPVLLLVPFALSTFWLGKKHMYKVIRMKLERGERPFNDL